MNRTRWALLVTLGLCAVGMTGCKNGKGERDSQWFLAHSTELQEKLASCKAHPETARADRECVAATEAFVKWYKASGWAAKQARIDAEQADARLTPPASPQPSPDPDAHADAPGPTVAPPKNGKH